MKKNDLNLLFILLFVCFGCKKTTQPNESIEIIDTKILEKLDTNFISLTEALEIATNPPVVTDTKSQQKSLNSTHQKNAIKKIKRVIKNHFVFSAKVENTALKGVDKSPREEPLIYLINYDGGGACVVSADSRFGEIIVQLDKNITLTENMEAPDAFIEYLENASNSIKKIKEGRLTKKINVTKKQSSLKPPSTMDEYSECADEFWSPLGSLSWSCFPGWEYFLNNEGPIVQTLWGQGTGYNDLIPFNCGNDKAPTGCVATAMAQALSVIQKPTSYNWSLMNNFSGSTETARLMRDLGVMVDMNYTCGGSGAHMNKANDAFHSMGINTTYVSYDITATYPSLENYGTWIRNRLISTTGYGSVPALPARPIIASGCKTVGMAGWWIFKRRHYTNCHAWLIDGYRDRRYSGSTLIPGSQYRYPLFKEETFHFNFGWDGFFDGWYKLNFADSSGYIDPSINYLWGQDLIVDIR